ncbi:MAG: hypothetical protein K2Q09_08580, partial [Phycisphaerales bacterium]|nr:hypothetical protein [Phycisphaerales bacterium]
MWHNPREPWLRLLARWDAVGIWVPGQPLCQTLASPNSPGGTKRTWCPVDLDAYGFPLKSFGIWYRPNGSGLWYVGSGGLLPSAFQRRTMYNVPLQAALPTVPTLGLPLNAALLGTAAWLARRAALRSRTERRRQRS